ncbi:FadR/GntR family transcriptional regulator [Lederbergia wuyishanensis]|uniref:DNA-binding FadR family transcriptional regulator n=1 Tax=Lederbergia wuyishanensis TaxID=1347903 RepID=A0ABU0D5A2_9BACI|nr:GntR family transcriptional regulator [Lederbergia wuyishanensis]MCJ8009634.1 GntR family transcriptional regulator [Lederbergia wuyishanensis]MDQ0343543.1 DNA-binding FadR family transcriptional regulator [Lederbergia wuyishanensis]
MKEEVSQSKVYLSIVKDIRQMISDDGLKQGDKIPSERELTERLNVGRSSVREALRSLELLGLIETRRGEGTFLADFKNNQLIKLLGMFILEDPNVKNDIVKTKEILEKDIIRNICSLTDKEPLYYLRKNVNEVKSDLFDKIMEIESNRLLYRIWEVLKSYSIETSDNRPQFDSNGIILFLDALIEGNSDKAIAIYERKDSSQSLN